MRKSLIFLIFGIIILIGACDINSGRVDVEKEEEVNTIDSIELRIARMKAETHLIKYRDVYKEWENAKIDKYYLWYNPMIEDKPAYVEFKIVKDGKDAGYIMVSVTEKDVVVPEYHTEGKVCMNI